ncbi:aromatic-L-amino-acid decarboxylase [Hyalella azteca]|uniref:Aromatic-L-amino-acid decarboxylase n=1 Tax=Hyalella azteca TaxID=294128 RepID=A0A8B7N376_HYAAZ|nr:aromatic-L-amino-acid decarboxylase [Hyalella azteca]
MDSEEFRQRGREMVDYIAGYLDNIDERRVTPKIEPGYLRPLLPDAAPQDGESWDDIMADIETKIMPGVTHWQHPRFHAYFPSGNSYPSILGDMLSDAIGCIGFSWAASPACTELETIVLDWLGQMVGLPESFLAFPKTSKGGGVIQSSASECVFVTLLAARAHKIRELKISHPEEEEGVLLSKLIAYCSKEAHSCVEKAAMMAFTKLRILEPDENQSLRGDALAEQIARDKEMGFIPFYVETTLGTTSCCSYDNIQEIGPVCEQHGVWLHVDGAYAGNSFICPELRGPMAGIEYASSFNFNTNKFMLTNFDCSVMWVQDRFRLTQALVVDPLYLQHSYSEQSIDYRMCIRDSFESFVLQDERFEVCSPVHLGLVCFRLNGSNEVNQKLLSSINASGRLHMVPASLGEKYVIRFCVCAQNATDDDIEHAWNVITEFATDLKEIMAQDAVNDVGTKTEAVNTEEVFHMVDRQTRRSLRYKRSCFVRMVSDPKLYNPKINPSPTGSVRSRHPTVEHEVNGHASSGIPIDSDDTLRHPISQASMESLRNEFLSSSPSSPLSPSAFPWSPLSPLALNSFPSSPSRFLPRTKSDVADKMTMCNLIDVQKLNQENKAI